MLGSLVDIDEGLMAYMFYGYGSSCFICFRPGAFALVASGALKDHSVVQVTKNCWS